MPAFAQQQTEQGQRTAQADDCTRLVDWARENPENRLAETPQQLAELQRRDDQQRCRELIVQLNEGQPDGTDGRIVVQQASPSVRIDQAEPRITVQQSQPNVAVTQPQPQITVRQPAPQVTINIPQPEIIVRMPEPDVRVSQAEPRVQVALPEPEVQVIQPEQQAQVLMEQDTQPQVQVVQPDQQANVAIERSGQPDVRYEAEEPQVRIQREEGEPAVRYEQVGEAATGQRAGEREQTAAAAGQGEDRAAAQRTEQAFQAVDGEETTGAVASQDTREFRAADLEGMDVVNARGNQLGDVERLVLSTADNRTMAIVAHGGFLGLGEKKVAVPLDSMAMADDRLVVPGLSDDEIRAMPEWRENSPNFRAVADDAGAQIRLQP